MCGMAVFLVEGVLLGNWLLLEFDKNATIEIKARYGIWALIMYVGMLIIGWAHEGPVGLVFRGALLLALVGSGWDTYIYTLRKVTTNADRDIRSSWKVRRHARKLAEKLEILTEDTDYAIEVAQISARKRTNLYALELREDLDKNKQTWFHASLLPVLDAKFDIAIDKAIEIIDQDENMAKSFPRLPDRTKKQAQNVSSSTTTGGLVDVHSTSSRQEGETKSAEARRWEEIYPELPNIFSRQIVQDHCDCSKAWASRLIAYGKSIDAIYEGKRGIYHKYGVDNAPQLPEVTQASSLPEGTPTEQLPVVTVHTPGLISTEPTPIAVSSQEDLPLTPEGDVDKFYVIREKLDGTGWEAVCAICTQGVYYGQNRREVSDSIEAHVRSQHTSPADFS